MRIEEFLVKHFGWTKQQIMAKQRTLDFVHFKDEAVLMQRAQFFQNLFNLTDSELKKIVGQLPTLFSISEATLRNKQKFFCEEFKLDKQEFTTVLKKLPMLLCLKEESIKNKVDFYCQNFDLTHDEFNKMFKSIPSLLSFGEGAVLNKVNFYGKKLKMNQEQINQMVKNTPVLLCLKEESIQNKLVQIADLRITPDDILKNPRILTVPENTLKIRYLLLRQVVSKEEILASNTLIINQDKTYARMAYFKNEKHKDVSLSVINMSEKEFGKNYGANTNALQEKYRLTPLKIIMLKTVLAPGEMKNFNQAECDYIKDNYGAERGR